jgi:hypothetical protein
LSRYAKLVTSAPLDASVLSFSLAQLEDCGELDRSVAVTEHFLREAPTHFDLPVSTSRSRQVARLAPQIHDPKARADTEDNFRKIIGQALMPRQYARRSRCSWCFT